MSGILAEPSPRPWQVRYGDTVADATGAKVAACWRPENAALIVAAVNYYKPDLHCDWRELTPEEAVAPCHEVAARLGDTPCARDHLQLATWIEERDRLRDTVRKMLHAIDALYTVAAPGAIVKELAPDRICLGVPIGKIVTEARAAIGEDAK